MAAAVRPPMRIPLTLRPWTFACPASGTAEPSQLSRALGAEQAPIPRRRAAVSNGTLPRARKSSEATHEKKQADLRDAALAMAVSSRGDRHVQDNADRAACQAQSQSQL
jgi:hypothetical protein